MKALAWFITQKNMVELLKVVFEWSSYLPLNTPFQYYLTTCYWDATWDEALGYR